MTTTFDTESTRVSNALQIKTQKDEFLGAITTVFGAISAKATLPILANILLQTDRPDQVVLSGTDLELGIKTRFSAIVQLQGAITIPAKKLYEIVRELGAGEVEITVGKNNAVNIKTNKSFFKIMGLEPDDFPKLPEPTTEQSFEIDRTILKRCLSLTTFAISRDETRYTLNGVLSIFKNKRARFVATDGKRLASIEKEIQLPGEFASEVIIPAKAISEVIKALPDGQGKVGVSLAQNQIMFQIDDTILISRLIEGRFPNYEQVIPKDVKTKTDVNRQELLSCLKRVSLLTSQENQAVKIDFIKDRLLISSRSPNMGEAKEEVEAKISGDDLTIGFNPTYIIDVLKNLNNETITLAMTDPDKPGLIKSEDDYIYVVMPMQLN